MKNYYKNRKAFLYIWMLSCFSFLISVIFQIIIILNFYLSFFILKDEFFISIKLFFVTVISLTFIINQSKKAHIHEYGNIVDAAKWNLRKLVFLTIIYSNILSYIFN